MDSGGVILMDQVHNDRRGEGDEKKREKGKRRQFHLFYFPFFLITFDNLLFLSNNSTYCDIMSHSCKSINDFCIKGFMINP